MDLYNSVLKQDKLVQFPDPIRPGCTVEQVFYEDMSQSWVIVISHPDFPEVNMPTEYHEMGGRYVMRMPPKVAGEWLAKILIAGAKVFKKAKDGDAGYDIFVTGYLDTAKQLIPKSFELYPDNAQLFMTGIATAFPLTHVGLVCDRSGYGVKGLMKQAGVIDSNYRGEWGCKLYNTSNKPITIESVLENPNAKAACQVVFVPCADEEFQIVDTLPLSVRGDQWQGSSDAKAISG